MEDISRQVSEGEVSYLILLNFVNNAEPFTGRTQGLSLVLAIASFHRSEPE